VNAQINLTALEDRDTPSAALVFPAERLAAFGLDPSRVAALTLQLSDNGAVEPIPVSFAPAELSAIGEVSDEPLSTVLNDEPVQPQVASETPAQTPVDFGRPVTVPASRLNPFLDPARVAALTFVPTADGTPVLVPVAFLPDEQPAPAQIEESEQPVRTQGAALPAEQSDGLPPGTTYYDAAAGRWRVAGAVSIGLALGDDGIARPIEVG
jgi:hypothetical protein